MPKRVFLCILGLGLLALLFFSPALITGGLHKNVYTLREAERAKQYQGALSLWHIVSFPTSGGSGVSFLTERASSFEKSHPYVFITVEGLTTEEARDRLAAGERPDLISYPLGFVSDPSMLLSLSEPEASLLDGFSNAGKLGDTWLSYPYMADFYTITCNQEIVSGAGLSLPLESGFSRERLQLFLRELSDLSPQKDSAEPFFPLAQTTTEGLHPACALLSLPFLEEEELFLTEESPSLPSLSKYSSSQADLSSFLSKNSAMYLSTYGESLKLAQDNRAASLSLSSYLLSAYTDMVQMIGVCATEDTAKAALCQEFCASLLTERVQQALSEATGMLSVLSLTESPHAGQFLPQEAEALFSSSVLCPNGFALSLWSEETDSLVHASLQGDATARQALEAFLFPDGAAFFREEEDKTT